MIKHGIVDRIWVTLQHRLLVEDRVCGYAAGGVSREGQYDQITHHRMWGLDVQADRQARGGLRARGRCRWCGSSDFNWERIRAQCDELEKRIVNTAGAGF